MPTITSSWSTAITELGTAVTMAERAGEEGAGHTGAQGHSPSWGKKKWKKQKATKMAWIAARRHTLPRGFTRYPGCLGQRQPRHDDLKMLT